MRRALSCAHMESDKLPFPLQMGHLMSGSQLDNPTPRPTHPKESESASIFGSSLLCTFSTRGSVFGKNLSLLKLAGFFFCATAFFKMAALGNRPSQSFKFSRAPEKIAPRTVVRQKLSPSGRCGAGASAEADAGMPCIPDTRQLSL